MPEVAQDKLTYLQLIIKIDIVARDFTINKMNSRIYSLI